MTRKEFERMRLAIEREEFRDDSPDPISYALQRAAFEQRKFAKLIAAARRVNLQTVRAKVQRWERQLARARQTQRRFEQLRGPLPPVPNPPPARRASSMRPAS